MIGNMEEKTLGFGKDNKPAPTIGDREIITSEDYRRGDFITYYEPVVKAAVLVNVQDWYWYVNPKTKKKAKRYVYYKAFNVENKHLYYDGSRLVIDFDDYKPIGVGHRLALPNEIKDYLDALKKENLTL